MRPSILPPLIRIVAEHEVGHAECGRVGLCRHGEEMLSSRSDEAFQGNVECSVKSVGHFKKYPRFSVRIAETRPPSIASRRPFAMGCRFQNSRRVHALHASSFTVSANAPQSRPGFLVSPAWAAPSVSSWLSANQA